MNERSLGALRDSLPNTRKSYGYKEKMNQTAGKVINAQTIAGRVEIIIEKHWKIRALLHKCYPNL